MKKICFCVIIGGYDNLLTPIYVTEGWEYICITDQEISSDFWKIIKVKNDELDQKWFSRYIWTHYYEYFDCDIALKHDACMLIKNNLDLLLNYLTDDIDIVLAEHDRRNCIYQEADAVNFRFPEYTDLVNKQMLKYKNNGFPINYGLYYQGVKIIKNSEKIRIFNKMWWDEIKNGSWRDQLSFDYVRWKTNDILKINTISYNDLKRKYFVFNKHK